MTDENDTKTDDSKVTKKKDLSEAELEKIAGGAGEKSCAADGKSCSGKKLQK